MKQKMMILCMAAVGATTVLHAQTRDKGTLTGSPGVEQYLLCR